MPPIPNLSRPKQNSKIVTGQTPKTDQTYSDKNFQQNRNTKRHTAVRRGTLKEEFFEMLLGLFVVGILALIVVGAYHGAIGAYHGLFKSDPPSAVDNDFANSISDDFFVAIRELSSTNSEIQFNMSAKFSTWDFVQAQKMPGDLPVTCSGDSQINFKNENRTAEIVLCLTPDTIKRTLIAKQNLIEHLKETRSYEIFLYFNHNNGKMQIEKNQIYLVSKYPNRYDPFLGHIYEFSNEDYQSEKIADYSPGKCLVIDVEGEVSQGYTASFDSFKEKLTDLLPNDIIATNLSELSTIFRITKRDVVRQHYSNDSTRSEAFLDVEVIDTRKKPFKIVKTASFTAGYIWLDKVSIRYKYNPPLPIEAVKDFIISLYKPPVSG